MSWIKYVVIALILLGIIIFTNKVSLKHQANIASTQDIDSNLSSVYVGEAREFKETSFNKELIVSNLLLEIAETQKGKHYKTEVDYVFLNQNGVPTQNDNEIRSIQFDVKLINRDGVITSNSVERIEIDSLLNEK